MALAPAAAFLFKDNAYDSREWTEFQERFRHPKSVPRPLDECATALAGLLAGSRALRSLLVNGVNHIASNLFANSS